MILQKELFENGSAKLEVYESGGIWIGVGLAGLFLRPEELTDLMPLLKAYEQSLEES